MEIRPPELLDARPFRYAPLQEPRALYDVDFFGCKYPCEIRITSKLNTKKTLYLKAWHNFRHLNLDNTKISNILLLERFNLTRISYFH